MNQNTDTTEFLPCSISESIMNTIVALQSVIKTLEITVREISKMDKEVDACSKCITPQPSEIIDAIQIIIENADDWISHPRDVNHAIKTFLSCFRALETAGHSVTSIIEYLKRDETDSLTE